MEAALASLADEEVALEVSVVMVTAMVTATGWEEWEEWARMDKDMDDEVAMAVVAIARALEKDLFPPQENILKVKVKAMNQTSPDHALTGVPALACMAAEAHTKDEEEVADAMGLVVAEEAHHLVDHLI